MAEQHRTEFDRVVCINLDARMDRWAQFIAHDWPFSECERYAAVNGNLCRPPKWWSVGAGAWGCYRSHLNIIEQCLNTGVKSVLILEDDAQPVDDFAARYKQFMQHVPDAWGMLYLGGQHLGTPMKINPYVVKAYNVNRTHAYALRGSTLLAVYKYLSDTKPWPIGQHIDHRLGAFHAQRVHNVYAPTEWLVAQGAGTSDVSRKEVAERNWNPAKAFTIVLGLHRSGSSMVAGMLAQLGFDFGRDFVGCEPDGGYEAREFVRICEQCLPFGATKLRVNGNRIKQMLDAYVRSRQYASYPAAKYPQLCAIAKYLDVPNLQVVHCNRPTEESITSLIKRVRLQSGGRHDADKLRAHQEYLERCKLEFLAGHPHVTLNYGGVLADPTGAAAELVAGLGLGYDGDAIGRAAGYVRPELRSVGTARERAGAGA